MIANGMPIREAGSDQEEFDERVKKRVEPAAPAHRNTDRDPDEKSRPETDGEVDHAHFEIQKQPALFDEADKGEKNIGGRRQDKGIPDDDCGGDLPDYKSEQQGGYSRHRYVFFSVVFIITALR